MSLGAHNGQLLLFFLVTRSLITNHLRQWENLCTAWALHVHYVQCPHNETKPRRKGRNPCIYAGITRVFIFVVVGDHGQAQSVVALVCWKMVAAFWGHRHSALTQLGPNLQGSSAGGGHEGWNPLRSV